MDTLPATAAHWHYQEMRRQSQYSDPQDACAGEVSPLALTDYRGRIITSRITASDALLAWESATCRYALVAPRAGLWAGHCQWCGLPLAKGE